MPQIDVMNTTARLFATLILCGAGLLGATHPVSAQRSGPDSPDALRARYIAAYNAGDATAMESLYVDSASRMAYDAPAQQGRAAIVSGYRTTFARRTFTPSLELRALEMRVASEWAMERGSYRELLTPRNGNAALVERGKYVSLARRGPDGRWRYEWSIFNRDAPAHALASDGTAR